MNFQGTASAFVERDGTALQCSLEPFHVCSSFPP